MLSGDASRDRVAAARPLVLSLDDSPIAAAIAQELGGEDARFDSRRFPDAETYLRVDAPVSGRDVWFVARLDRPDERLVQTLLAAATLRDLGARHITLVAPYLPYLRQDQRFRAGEAISARYVAEWIGREVDAVFTVDPHLHRLGGLSEVYSIPAVAISAAPAIAEWVAKNVERPLIVGPDEEASQWAEAVASVIGAPHTTFLKDRRGDRDVIVSGDVRLDGHTPVLIDDIISSGMTIAGAAELLRTAGAARVECVCVHALFAPGANRALAAVDRVVSTNTVPHATNAVDVSPLIAAACARAPE